MIAAAALTVAALGTLAHGAYYRNSPVFGRALGSLPAARGERVVALTFDDGPNPEATPRILDALAEADVKATFFLLGRHVDRWPDIARRVATDGHVVANHGWHHRKLHSALPARARLDLEMGTRSIERATGVRPRLFRAPHGFRAPWVTPIAASLGQRTIGWSLGVWDSDRPGAQAIVDRTVVGARPGAIVLLHDGDGYDPLGDRLQTAEAVPLIVRELHGRGYRFAPVPS
jgi:peptidoglycan/xylan/chitin deacetylase (PgdA/CDA1 family)